MRIWLLGLTKEENYSTPDDILCSLGEKWTLLMAYLELQACCKNKNSV